MTPEDRATLLGYARRCVEAAAQGRTPPDLDAPPPALAAPGAAFVTLHTRGELRGCIGHTEAHKALWESVRDMAEAAATRDPRFSPLQQSEPVSIELSVLSPLVPLRPEEIRPGIHGLCIRAGLKSGLLLPQVARERGWTTPQFLDQTCLKAGLSPGAWRDPSVEILGFTAEILN